MKRPCYCVRHWRILLGLVLVPPLLWIGFLALLPTKIARDKIAATISAASGRAVKIGALEVSFFGGVQLADLEIGAPTSGDNPWLSIRSAKVDLHPLQLFLGMIEPTQIDVDGMDIRILRRVDGSLELADFLNPADPQRISSSLDEPHGKHCVSLKVRNANVTIIDDPTATRLRFEDVVGSVTCDGIVTTITDISGRLNDGTVRLAGRFDRSGAQPSFEGQVRARDVIAGENMGALGYFLPILSGRDTAMRDGKKFEGRLLLDFYLEGEGNTREALRKSLKGEGRIDLDPIAVEGSETLNDLARLLQVPHSERFGSARADLALKQGRMTSENLTLTVAKIPLAFSGWTDIDGNVKYRLKTDALSDRVPSEVRQFLNAREIDLSEVAKVEVAGTVGGPKVLLNGEQLLDPKSENDDGRRVREIGRRIRDRVRR